MDRVCGVYTYQSLSLLTANMQYEHIIILLPIIIILHFPTNKCTIKGLKGVRISLSGKVRVGNYAGDTQSYVTRYCRP